MRIINLVENTEGTSGCGVEHGLCFYIETEKHKLLMDTGRICCSRMQRNLVST